MPRLAGRFRQGTVSTLPFSGPFSSLTSPGRAFSPCTPELPGISSLPPAARANVPYSSCPSSPLPPLPRLQALLPPEPVLQRAGQMGVPDARAADLWTSGTVSMCAQAPLDPLPLPTLCHPQAWDRAPTPACTAHGTLQPDPAALSPTATPKPRVCAGEGMAAAVLPPAARPAACAQPGDSVLGMQMGRHSSGAEFPWPCSQLAGLGGGSMSACGKRFSVRFHLWMLSLLFASGHCPAGQLLGERMAGWGWAQLGEDPAPAAPIWGGTPPTQRRGGRGTVRGDGWDLPLQLAVPPAKPAQLISALGSMYVRHAGARLGDPLPPLASGTAPRRCTAGDGGAQSVPWWGGAWDGSGRRHRYQIARCSPRVRLAPRLCPRDPQGCWGQWQPGTELVHTRAFKKAQVERGQITKDRTDVLPPPGQTVTFPSSSSVPLG